MTLALTPITELDAVNACLANINESPVDTLMSTFGDALMARQLLHDNSRRIQSEGLICNTEYKLKIQPTTFIPTDNADVIEFSGVITSPVFNDTYTDTGDTENGRRVWYSTDNLMKIYYNDIASKWYVADILGSPFYTKDGTSTLPPKTGWVHAYTTDLEGICSYNYIPFVSGGEIILPTDTLKVINIYSRDLIERGRKLYDNYRHSYAINEEVVVNLVRFLEWDSLPQCVRNYITIATAREFANKVVGDLEMYQLTQEDELEARGTFNREQIDTAQVNMLYDSHSVFDTLHRDRIYPNWRY